jgi:hypothetical protein
MAILYPAYSGYIYISPFCFPHHIESFHVQYRHGGVNKMAMEFGSARLEGGQYLLDYLSTVYKLKYFSRTRFAAIGNKMEILHSDISITMEV